ncbi:PrcB C-terminal domain containing protein [Flavobacteriaceae bacterium]
MKRICLLFVSIILFSCSTTKSKVIDKPLFEVLTQQPDGGGNIHFFEIVSTSQEFRMLQGDEKLKGKITPNDINESNFLILNMGEKSINGCLINVVDVQETDNKIIVTVKEIEPKGEGITSADYVYPYCIVKINSKKEIVFK